MTGGGFCEQKLHEGPSHLSRVGGSVFLGMIWSEQVGRQPNKPQRSNLTYDP